MHGRSDAIKFVNDYSSMILEAKRKTAEIETEPEVEPSKAKTKCKKHPLKFLEEFISKIKSDGKKNKNKQIFRDYFFPQTPSSSAENLNDDNQIAIAKHVTGILNDSRKGINRKVILEQKNPKKIVDIVKKPHF